MDGQGLLITDQFMIGRRIPIGLLAEMVSAFLDALDITYVIYGENHEPRSVRNRPPLTVLPSVVVPFHAANSRPQA
jgi:hypothetical protein